MAGTLVALGVTGYAKNALLGSSGRHSYKSNYVTIIQQPLYRCARKCGPQEDCERFFLPLAFAAERIFTHV
jgi:hypothetical protein